MSLKRSKLPQVKRKDRKTRIWSSNVADSKFSHFIRDRDNGICFFCKRPGSQNSHFWGRGKSALRYEPDNCDYVCGGCHMRHEGSKQGLYAELKLKQLGQKRYDELRKLAFQSRMNRREAIIACMNLLKSYEQVGYGNNLAGKL